MASGLMKESCGLSGRRLRAQAKICIPINESAGEEGQIHEYLEAYRCEGTQ